MSRLTTLFVLVVLSGVVSASQFKHHQFEHGKLPKRATKFRTRKSTYELHEVTDGGTDFHVSGDDDEVYISMFGQSDDDVDEIQVKEPGKSGWKKTKDSDDYTGSSKARRERLMNGATVSGKTYRFRSRRLNKGQLKFKKRRGGGKTVVIVKYKGGRAMEVDDSDCQDVLVGSTCDLRVGFLRRDGTGCPECSPTVEASIGGETIQGTLDGATAILTIPISADHLDFSVTGTSSFGDIRTQRIVIRASNDFCTGIAGASMILNDQTHEVTLQVRLAVSGDIPTEPSLIRAEVFGASGGFVDVQGMSNHAADGSVSIDIQPEYFSSVQGPFHLENVEIISSLGYNTVCSAASVSVDTPSDFHPSAEHHRRHLASLGITESPEERTTRLTMGRRPNRQDRIQAVTGSSRSLRANAHSIVLVHGYCSEGVWPTSHFSKPTYTFNDFNQARENSQFAQILDDQTTAQGITGCGIVAHSQGGLASLHMYTYRWSCLDYPSTPGRMIQSIGSPYQGTNLAGVLADIGSLFGVQCGSVNDLTEGGATSWLSNIPSWARSKVWYRTTSFLDEEPCWCCACWGSCDCQYDFCSLADPVLSDPDDGVIEKARGQLSGGNNVGHNQGYCHTTGMEDPAQYQVLSWNQAMNNNAQT